MRKRQTTWRASARLYLAAMAAVDGLMVMAAAALLASSTSKKEPPPERVPVRPINGAIPSGVVR